MSRFGILLSGALLIVSYAAFAQNSTPTAPAATAPRREQAHPDSADKRLKRMSKRLNLTDDQKEKIRPILKDEENQVATAEADTTLGPQQKHKKIRQIHMATRSQIDGILTPDQKTQMPPAKTGAGGRRHQRTAPASTPSADSNTPQ